MFLFSEFYKFMGDIDRQSILLSPNFPGPHEFHNFMGKVRIQQNTFFFRVSYIYFISMLRVAGGECHISVFSKIMNFHWVLSLLSAYTPHSSQLGYFIYTPHSYQHFAKSLNDFKSYFLLALLSYLMNVGTISY